MKLIPVFAASAAVAFPGARPRSNGKDTRRSKKPWPKAPEARISPMKSQACANPADGSAAAMPDPNFPAA
jgi:hypothetical protein